MEDRIERLNALAAHLGVDAELIDPAQWFHVLDVVVMCMEAMVERRDRDDREYFAAAALTGLVGAGLRTDATAYPGEPAAFAITAYAFADAMLAQRKQQS